MNKKLLIILLLIATGGALSFYIFKTTNSQNVVEDFDTEDEEETVEIKDVSPQIGERQVINEDKNDKTKETQTSKELLKKNPNLKENEETVKAKVINNIIEEAQLGQEIQGMDDMLEAGLENFLNNPDLTEDERLEIQKIKEIVSGEKILGKIKEELANNMTKDELEELKDLYKNDIIKNITEIEAATRTEEGQREMMQDMQSFNKDSISEDRWNAIDTYNEKSGLEKRTISMLKNFTNAMPKAPGAPDAAKMFDDPNFKKSIREANRMTTALKLKNHNINDINDAGNLKSSNSYQKYEDIKGHVLTETMKQMGDAVGKMDKKKRKDTSN